MLATINVPYTGGWQNWITLSVTATLPAGQQSLQLYCTANHWNINWLELLPPATGSGGFNGSGAYHIEAEDFIAQNGTLLENCQDAGGTYNIGSINTGDWLDYRVNMPVGGSYQLSVRAASANSGVNTVQLLSATGTVLATLNVSNTGSYQTFATYTANVSLPAGVQTLRLAVTGGYMAVNWLELAAPNSTVPLDNYALVLNNNFNYTGGMVYEAENTFTVEFMVKPKVAHEIDVESTSGFSGTEGQKYVMFPVHGGSAEDSRAGMGISVGTNGVSVYEHADGYMPALLVWAYPIDTVWTHVAVVYHNGKPSLYINGVWKKDGLQSLKQHVYPGTQFPGGYYGSQGDGILDEVRIWSVARTEAQIAANKDGELTGPQTGLVGYWPMNEGTGLVLHDVSGSGRDVDLTSAGYTSTSWTNGRYSVASIVGSYRYAFNGQEHSTEIGDDDYTAEFWEYESRIGRRWNVDPIYKESISSYSVFYDNPLNLNDSKGNTPTPTKKSVNIIVTLNAEWASQMKDTKNENWVVLYANSIEGISEVVKSYLDQKNAQLGNLAFVHHGNNYGYGKDNKVISLGGNEFKKMNEIAKKIVSNATGDKPVDFVSQFKNASKNEFRESQADAYLSISDMLGQIASGGNYFSIACNEADDVGSEKDLNYMSGGKVNTYVNSNQTIVSSQSFVKYSSYNPKTIFFGSLINKRLTEMSTFINNSGWVYYNTQTSLSVSTGKDLILNSVGKPFNLVNSNFVDQNAFLKQQYFSKTYNDWVKKNSGNEGHQKWLDASKTSLGLK